LSYGGDIVTTCSREGSIDFFLGEVLGLEKGYPLLNGRAGDGGVLEDWRAVSDASRLVELRIVQDI
jgi:hypothetical protein